MVDIEQVKSEIIERLLPLNPDKIILFGSYAYGKPTEDSDIDLFLLKKNLPVNDIKHYKQELQKKLFDIQKKYLLGIDLFVDTPSRMKQRIVDVKDQFYEEVLHKGKVIYAK